MIPLTPGMLRGVRGAVWKDTLHEISDGRDPQFFEERDVLAIFFSRYVVGYGEALHQAS